MELGADVVTIGTIIGALIGTITFLLRILVSSKSAHIKTLEDTLASVRAERDLFRDLTLSGRHRDDPPRQHDN
jgi:hypothetical protein